MRSRLPHAGAGQPVIGSVPPVTDRDHVRGPAAAPVTLVEYGDFQCSHCRQASRPLETVRKRLGLRLVFRHLPLRELHPRAVQAAYAAEAAGAQGEFWTMHDALYGYQRELDDASLIRRAEALGLDVERFVLDMNGPAAVMRVRADVSGARDAGVHATPTFFVNGRHHESPWPQLLEQLSRAHAPSS